MLMKSTMIVIMSMILFQIDLKNLLCSIVYTFETKNGKKTGQNNFTYCKNNKCADGKLPDLSSLEPKKQLVTPATLNDTNNTNFFNNVNEKLFSRSQHSTPENE